MCKDNKCMYVTVGMAGFLVKRGDWVNIPSFLLL